MTISFVKKLMLCAVQLSMSLSLYGAISNIKNTYDVIKPGYKHLAVTNGFALLNSGMVRNFYDFGHVFPVFGKDNHDRDVITGYEKLDASHYTIRLVHALFYRVPGSTAPTDFGISTKLPKKMMDNLEQFCSECAGLLAALHTFDKHASALQNFISRCLDKKELQQKHRTTIEALGKNLWSKNHYKTAQSVPVIKNASENEKMIYVACQDAVGEVRRASLSLFGNFLTNNLKPLSWSEIFIRSLYECDESNQKAMYVPHMTYSIVLAVFYEACGHDRGLIAHFYNELHKKLNNELLKHDLDETWIKDSFQSMSEEEAADSIKTSTQNGTIEDTEFFVYALSQIHSFPKPHGYENANYSYKKAGADAVVQCSDCMENAIRNFLNMLTYNKKSNCYDSQYLKKRLGHDVNPALENFYKKHSSIAKASKKEAHDDWMQIVSNILYVTYHDHTPEQGIVPAQKYVSIPDGVRKNLKSYCANKQCVQLPDHVHGFNLIPSVKNIIIILDHLLYLNLFENGLESVFMNNDFIATHFTTLCKKLNIKESYFSNSSAYKHDADYEKKIDMHDENSIVHTTLIFESFDGKKVVSTFRTSRGHGECMLRAQGSSSEDQVFNMLHKKRSLFSDNAVLDIVVSEFLNRKKFSTEHKQQFAKFFSTLFTTPLENTDYVHQNYEYIIESLKNLQVERSFSLKTTEQLLLRLAKLQPDVNVQKAMHINILRLCLRDNDCADAIDAAGKGISNPNGNVHNSALSLFKMLFENNKGFKEAIDVATKGINDCDDTVCNSARELFRRLIQKNQGFEEAIDAATKGINDPNGNVRNSALKLFRILIENNQGFEEAIDAATKGINDPNGNVRNSALKLFRILFENNKGFKEAADAANKGINDPNGNVRKTALGLFRRLIKNNQGFEEAADAATKGINDPNDNVHYSALSLFRMLIGNNKGFKEAADAATKGINDPNHRVGKTALRLFKVLFKMNRGFEEAIDAAGKGINDPNVNVHYSALALLVRLHKEFDSNLTISQIHNSNLSVTGKLRLYNLKRISAQNYAVMVSKKHALPTFICSVAGFASGFAYVYFNNK